MNGNPGGLIIFRYIPQLQLLGKADLERTNLLVDRLQRADAPTFFKLLVLQGYVRNAPVSVSTQM
jgi:hypothetical protein